MLNDLTVIVKQFPADWPFLRLYAIGDVHAGSEQFNEHTPMYYPHGVIRIDAKHAKASWVAYHEIIVDANLTPGGYSIKHEYEIAPPPELQYLEMRVIRDSNRERTLHKVIDYHAIQI